MNTDSSYTENEINTSKTELTITRFIENNKTEDLVNLIKTKLTKFEIANMKFGQNSETILHKLIIMDIQTLFSNTFQVIKEKFEKEEFIQFINLQDIQGNTALLYAVFKGNYDIVKTLIDNGADYTMRNFMGLSVMHMCAQGDRPNLLIYFKDKYNFDIFDRDFNGNTPLHIAIHTLRPKLIKKLLYKGADLYKKNNNGESVYDIISENNDSKEFENVFRVVTESKPMKYCIYSDNKEQIEEKSKNKCIKNKNVNLFNSIMFITLHLVSEILLYFILLPFTDTLLNEILFFTIITLLFLSFIIVNNSDPGVVKCNIQLTWLEMVENKYYINNYCPYCKCQKTIKVKHCHICKRCVDGFDHHCNWIDNCVGDKNIGRFIFFIIIVIINLIFSYYIALEAFLSKEKVKPAEDNTTFFVFSWIYILNTKDMVAVFIMTVSIFFFFPVCFVLWIQIRNRLFKTRK